MEHISRLTKQQLLEVDEVYAKTYDAQRESELDSEERQAREEEEGERTQAQGARRGGHTTDTVPAFLEALFSWMTMKGATPEATS